MLIRTIVVRTIIHWTAPYCAIIPVEARSEALPAISGLGLRVSLFGEDLVVFDERPDAQIVILVGEVALRDRDRQVYALTKFGEQVLWKSCFYVHSC